MVIQPDPKKLRRIQSAAIDKGYANLLRPVMFRMHGADPEHVHETMINTLARTPRSALSAMHALVGSDSAPTTVCDIEFDGRVGLAAGLDKDGRAARAWAALGFAFAELGTVTPRPQMGNDKPRVFRLTASKAIINRMGFNNAGAAHLAEQLKTWGVERGNRALGIPLGISIGKNKDTPLETADDDYVNAFETVAPYADYVAVNVSSPNTPGLRSLQGRSELTSLLTTLATAAKLNNRANPVPIWLKMAPDLEPAAVDEALEVATDCGISAIIATNTTLSRQGLSADDATNAFETGGLSGAPLTAKALQVVKQITASTDLPVIGVGGIMTADHAKAMLDAGASLVQLYTGFIYRGPALIREINQLSQTPTGAGR